MSTHTRIFVLSAIILLLVGCRKDEITYTSEDNNLPNTEQVKFQLLIANESGLPIADAQVLINSDTYSTDQNGVIITQLYDIPYLGLKTEVSAPGFESLIKMLNGPENSIAIEKIVLTKAVTKYISTGDTGEIDGGGTLTLPTTMVTTSGSTYEGEVTVRHKYLDPDNREFLLAAPGNLLALNDEEEYQQLASLGMYMIELYDQNGNELKIPEGSTATISFPIAEKHKGEINSDIPLWYFDEEEGIWKEDGVAAIQDEMMVAEVSHFTWWNCDLPYDFSEICLLFVDDEGEAIAGLEVEFSIGGLTFGIDITDNNGVILAKIPLGQVIELTYYLNDVEIGAQEIGSFLDNVRKFTVFSDLDVSTISGVALDCEGNPVTVGYSYYSIDGNISGVPISEDGIFSFISPETDFILDFIDYGNDELSELTVAAEASDIDLGFITVCNGGIVSRVSGYVRLDLDEDNYGDTPIENALILVSVVGIGGQFEIYTDENGYYEQYLPPGSEFTVVAPGTVDYAKVANGDSTPEGDVVNFDKEEYRFGNFGVCRGVVDAGENDADNDFLFIEAGIGTFSGTMMGDVDEDGVGDIPLKWGALLMTPSVHWLNVEENGTFSSSVAAGVYQVNFWFQNWGSYWSGVDTSPEPDGFGYDNAPYFNVVVYKDEVDADNEFVVDLSTLRTVLVRVMEDTNNDGVGDVAITDVGVNMFNRTSGILLSSINTNPFGIATLFGEGEDYAEVSLNLSPTILQDYEIIDLVEETSDNDPLIIGGDLSTMEINLALKEWDAGNIFVVRKK